MDIRPENRIVLYLAILAFIIVAAGLVFIYNASYRGPALAVGSGNVSFRWGDVYDISSVKKYRYEVISIIDGEINRSSALYTKSYDQNNNIVIGITTFEGVSPREVYAYAVIDPITYKCIAKYYESIKKMCIEEFGDYETDLAARSLPYLMRKNERFSSISADSAVYGGKYREAVRVSKGEVVAWVVENAPLPVRIEIIDSNGMQTIANLKSYN